MMISRRVFITAMGGGLLSLRMARAQKTQFELGIGTYTYRGVSEEQMIEDLRALKIRQIELSSPNYFLPAVKLDAIQKFRAKLSRGGITAVSYFAGDLKTEEDIDTTVNVARELGVSHVSGSAVGQTLKMVDTRFAREGLRFGIH